jgi:hypothetical protein
MTESVSGMNDYAIAIACAPPIVNRMKATLARLGIRNFKPTLRKAAERIATLHTAEGMPLPPNVSAESSARRRCSTRRHRKRRDRR